MRVSEGLIRWKVKKLGLSKLTPEKRSIWVPNDQVVFVLKVPEPRAADIYMMISEVLRHERLMNPDHIAVFDNLTAEKLVGYRPPPAAKLVLNP